MGRLSDLLKARLGEQKFTPSENCQTYREIVWILLQYQLNQERKTIDWVKEKLKAVKVGVKKDYDSVNISITIAGAIISKIPVIGSTLSSIMSLFKNDPYELWKALIAQEQLGEEYRYIGRTKPIVRNTIKNLSEEVVINDVSNDDRLNRLALLGASYLSFTEDFHRVENLLLHETTIQDLYLHELIERLINSDWHTTQPYMDKVDSWCEQYPESDINKLVPPTQFAWNHMKPYTSLYMPESFEVLTVLKSSDQNTQLSFSKSVSQNISGRHNSVSMSDDDWQ